MFGLIGRSKKELTPLPVWDDWNERFEYADGNHLTKYAISTLTFMSEEFGEEISVRVFFSRLLSKLWEEGDDFNPKKPFGAGGWKQDLMRAFIKHNLIKGEIKPDGKIVDCDEHVFQFLIQTYLKETNE